MRKNPHIIRTRPDTVTRVMGVVKDHLQNAERASLTEPLSRTGPTVSFSRGDRTCISAKLDRKMGNKVDIVSRGGRFDVTFGPALSIMDVVQKVKQFAGSRHGAKMAGVMAADFVDCAKGIFLSATAGAMNQFINFDGPRDKVPSSDVLGNPFTIEVIVGARKVSGVEGSADRYPADVTSALLVINIPQAVTLRQMKGSWEADVFGGSFMQETRRIVEHEVTHLVDPGTILERYQGGPEEILGISDEDRRATILAAMEGGHHESAKALQDLYEKAYEKYASQPHELRAESSVALRYMRLYAVFWSRKNGRPMPPRRAMEIMEEEIPDVARLYSKMSERAKAQLQRYVIQALQEEGLVSS
jgi:hypothetical protein